MIRSSRTVLLVVLALFLLFNLAKSILSAEELLKEFKEGAFELNSQELSESKQFGFAEELFKKKLYYWAITEYLRFIFYFPQSLLADDAQYKVGLSYFKGERWEESVSAFQTLLNNYPDSEFCAPANYKIAETYFNEKDYELAAIKFRKFVDKFPQESLADDAQMMASWSHLHLKDWKRASLEFQKIENKFPHSDLKDIAGELSQDAQKGLTLPHKSTKLSLGLSTILPGIGQIYCGRRADGLIAMLVNGHFIYNIVQGYSHRNQGRGNTHLYFGLPFYLGNIYGAKVAAIKFNRRTREEHIRKMEDKYLEVIKEKGK